MYLVTANTLFINLVPKKIVVVKLVSYMLKCHCNYSPTVTVLTGWQSLSQQQKLGCRCFTVKTLVVKGKAPVDPECHVANSMHVYVEGSEIYDVMLNQVCISVNTYV